MAGKPAAAASNFRIDIKGAGIRRLLSAAGIQVILLKGAAFAHLLYAAPGERSYNDVDLLLDATDLEKAQRVLADSGFERFDEDSVSAQTDPSIGTAIGALGALHGGAWARASDGLVVDLHTSLPQVTADPATVWLELSGHTDRIEIGGTEAEVLDAPASALVAALHAAHHGPEWGPTLMDLGRAVHVLRRSDWIEARDLAASLDAIGPFGVGLGLDPDGAVLAQELGVATSPSPALRAMWAGGTWTTIVLTALRSERPLTARLRLAVRLTWPSPGAMRRGSVLARRGRPGLAAAYLLRPFQLALLLWGRR